MNLLDIREVSDFIRRGQKRAVPKSEKEIIYPDSDGKPMSDNTKQFDWIVKIKENLEHIFADNSDVFVAGDLLWYPVKGNNRIRIAPDTMVVFGRPKGHRGSYKMWEEGNIAPQVVFEILSPGNTTKEMEKKLDSYERYGVQEYYVYDPDRILLSGWLRRNNLLNPIENMRGWISPLLKICFEIGDDDLYIFGPDGEKFLSRVESERYHKIQLYETERQYQKKLQEKQNELTAERLRAEQLAAKLRELGITV